MGEDSLLERVAAAAEESQLSQPSVRRKGTEENPCFIFELNHFFHASMNSFLFLKNATYVTVKCARRNRRRFGASSTPLRKPSTVTAALSPASVSSYLCTLCD